MGRKLIDLTGQIFEKLTVIRRVENNKQGESMWLCRCECGNTKSIRGAYLRSGHTKSCGCSRVKRPKENRRLYTIWHGMKQRCNNPKNPGYHNYGGRGIKVCAEWENSFMAFYEWAVSHGYEDDLSLDRVNNELGYSAENCRWAARTEQQRNTRTNHLVTYKGKTQCLAAWADELCIPVHTLYGRVAIGYTDEELFDPPKRFSIRSK